MLLSFWNWIWMFKYWNYCREIFVLWDACPAFAMFLTLFFRPWNGWSEAQKDLVVGIKLSLIIRDVLGVRVFIFTFFVFSLNILISLSTVFDFRFQIIIYRENENEDGRGEETAVGVVEMSSWSVYLLVCLDQEIGLGEICSTKFQATGVQVFHWIYVAKNGLCRWASSVSLTLRWKSYYGPGRIIMSTSKAASVGLHPN